MRMKLLIATRNPGKFKEIADLMAPLGAECLSPADLDITEDFEEGEDEFEANAIGKAQFYARRAPGCTVVADDSGLFVDALAGELGVKTRRWGAGAEASDEEWLEFFMNRMGRESNRRAKFVCAAALIRDEEVKVFVSEVHGVITEEVEAPVKPGIPVSSVFKPDGFERVYAAMSVEEKNRYSHRSGAFLQVLNHLKNA